MNQNSNSQGNLVVLLIPFFFHKKIGCLSSEDSTFTQEDIQAVWSHHPCILCTVQSQQHPPSPPPPPHGRFLCIGLLPEHLQCFFIRMPKDPSPTLHRFWNNFLAWRTSFIDTARNTLLKAVKLPSLRAICQSKTNLDNLDLQSHKIWQMLSLWKWRREFVLGAPPPPPPARTVSLHWFATRTNSYSVSSTECQKTLHRLFTVF